MGKVMGRVATSLSLLSGELSIWVCASDVDAALFSFFFKKFQNAIYHFSSD
jgi:hypothetical protein